MDISLTFGVWVLLVVALGSIGGGLVLYRQSRRVGWRAVGMSAVALGVGVLLVSTLTFPLSQSGEGETPEPVVELGKVVSTQPTDAPTTSQEPSSPPQDLTHGSPPPPAASGSPLHGDPAPSLKFGDVKYVHSGYAELPSGEGTVFVIDETEISVDDLERVGTTNDGNTAGIQEGLVVYRLKDDGKNDVYTFRPGKGHVNPEDGKIFKGQDSWTRWTTQ